MVRRKGKKEWMKGVALLIGLAAGGVFAAPTYAFAISVGWPVLEATLLALIPGIVIGGFAWDFIRQHMGLS